MSSSRIPATSVGDAIRNLGGDPTAEPPPAATGAAPPVAPQAPVAQPTGARAGTTQFFRVAPPRVGSGTDDTDGVIPVPIAASPVSPAVPSGSPGQLDPTPSAMNSPGIQPAGSSATVETTPAAQGGRGGASRVNTPSVESSLASLGLAREAPAPPLSRPVPEERVPEMVPHRPAAAPPRRFESPAQVIEDPGPAYHPSDDPAAAAAPQASTPVPPVEMPAPVFTTGPSELAAAIEASRPGPAPGSARPAEALASAAPVPRAEPVARVSAAPVPIAEAAARVSDAPVPVAVSGPVGVSEPAVGSEPAAVTAPALETETTKAAAVMDPGELTETEPSAAEMVRDTPAAPPPLTGVEASAAELLRPTGLLTAADVLSAADAISSAGAVTTPEPPAVTEAAAGPAGHVPTDPLERPWVDATPDEAPPSHSSTSFDVTPEAFAAAAAAIPEVQTAPPALTDPRELLRASTQRAVERLVRPQPSPEPEPVPEREPAPLAPGQRPSIADLTRQVERAVVGAQRAEIYQREVEQKAREVAASILSDAVSEAQRTIDLTAAEGESLLAAARAESAKHLSDVRSEAAKLLSETRAHADQLVSEAQSQAEKLISDGHAERDATIARGISHARAIIAHAEVELGRRVRRIVELTDGITDIAEMAHGELAAGTLTGPQLAQFITALSTVTERALEHIEAADAVAGPDDSHLAQTTKDDTTDADA